MTICSISSRPNPSPKKSEPMRLLYPLARRFIAGESLDEALPKVTALASCGFAVTLDLLGESVAGRTAAEAAVREYLLLLQALHAQGVECNISIKLTQLGLDIDPGLAREHLLRIVSEAARVGGFVRVDMEGSRYTGVTLDLVRQVHRQIPCVGAVIQAMLRRSPEDIATLCAEGIRVRLVKGAYKEPADVAWQRKPEVDAQFRTLAGYLLRHGAFPAIATHDASLIAEVQRLAQQDGATREVFEFQMLYGIGADLQEQLRREGWRVRLYIPYGDAWKAYVLRRLRERKENVWFVVKNLFR